MWWPWSLYQSSPSWQPTESEPLPRRRERRSAHGCQQALRKFIKLDNIPHCTRASLQFLHIQNGCNANPTSKSFPADPTIKDKPKNQETLKRELLILNLSSSNANASHFLFNAQYSQETNRKKKQEQGRAAGTRIRTKSTSTF